MQRDLWGPSPGEYRPRGEREKRAPDGSQSRLLDLAVALVCCMTLARSSPPWASVPPSIKWDQEVLL